MGARPLNRKIDELIRVPLSKKILFESLCDCVIWADLADDKIEFRVEQNTTTGVNEEGIIVVNSNNI